MGQFLRQTGCLDFLTLVSDRWLIKNKINLGGVAPYKNDEPSGWYDWTGVDKSLGKKACHKFGWIVKLVVFLPQNACIACICMNNWSGGIPMTRRQCRRMRCSFFRVAAGEPFANRSQDAQILWRTHSAVMSEQAFIKRATTARCRHFCPRPD